MNVSIDLDDFDENNIYFNKPVKNTVIDNSKFFRVTYSNDIFTMTGAHIRFKIASSEEYNKYNSCNQHFVLSNLEKNKTVVTKLIQIESKILYRLCIPEKRPVFKIWQKLNRGNFKLLANRYVLKISGVWETDEEYGITYRFFDISNV